MKDTRVSEMLKVARYLSKMMGLSYYEALLIVAVTCANREEKNS